MKPAWTPQDVSTSNVIFTNLQSDCSVGAMLDVHRLRVFRSVVASGSIQAAANNLGYTPSAVSQHVTALQRETGLALILAVGSGHRADRGRSGPGARDRRRAEPAR